MNIDLTPIIEAIIALLAGLITYKLIPWLKSRTTVEQQTAMNIAARTLVFAAEQIYGSGNGAEKFDYVVMELQKRGFDADPAIIEAAVRENIATLHTVKTEGE